MKNVLPFEFKKKVFQLIVCEFTVNSMKQILNRNNSIEVAEQNPEEIEGLNNFFS